jgi:hypothetical protein
MCTPDCARSADVCAVRATPEASDVRSERTSWRSWILRNSSSDSPPLNCARRVMWPSCIVVAPLNRPTHTLVIVPRCQCAPFLGGRAFNTLCNMLGRPQRCKLASPMSHRALDLHSVLTYVRIATLSLQQVWQHASGVGSVDEHVPADVTERGSWGTHGIVTPPLLAAVYLAR